jgi:hypothetical protein
MLWFGKNCETPNSSLARGSLIFETTSPSDDATLTGDMLSSPYSFANPLQYLERVGIDKSLLACDIFGGH